MKQKSDIEIIKELLILNMRHKSVSDEAIGRILNVSAKRVKNQFPIGKGPVEVKSTRFRKPIA